MKPDAEEPFCVLLGTDTGLVKCVDVAQDDSSTIIHGTPSQTGEIVTLTRLPSRELLVCLRAGVVLVLSEDGAVVRTRVEGFAAQKLVGAVAVETDAQGAGAIACCSEGGTLTLIPLPLTAVRMDAALLENFSLGKQPVERIAVDPSFGRVVAVGGKDNRLALWDMHSRKRLWQARNPPDDWLGMSVPTWISGIAFARGSAKVVASEAPGGEDTVDATVAVVSRYHKLERFETSLPSRRASATVVLGEHPLTCVCWTADNARVVVGNGVGVIWVVDASTWQPLGRMAPSCHGSVRDLVSCCPSLQGKRDELVIAVGLDRSVYTFRLHARTLHRKVYAKQKLCRVLPLIEEVELAPEEMPQQLVEIKQEESEEDADWSTIPVVGSSARKRLDPPSRASSTGEPPTLKALKKLKQRAKKRSGHK